MMFSSKDIRINGTLSQNGNNMFTGLIEETGTVKSISRIGGSVVFGIEGKKTSRGLRAGDSISVNGVCLTVIKKKKKTFFVQAVEETLSKTNLGVVKVPGTVNLERPLLPTTRLGGHFVLGHVDTVGSIEKVERLESSWMFWFAIPKKFARLLIPVGSVAINGVSLTVANLRGSHFAVAIIPQTMKVTTFRTLKVGDRVNVEFDVLGKYALNSYKSPRGRGRKR
jgi:riboflavin synthase